MVVVPPRRTTPVGLLAEGRAISLDLGINASAAVFRHGDWVIAVFDRAETLDLTQLQGSAIFRGMEARQTGDATILQMRHNVPAIATTVAKAAAVGAIDLGRAAVERFAPMTATSLGAAAAFQAIQQPTGPAKFARNGSFSATWKVAPRA